MRLLIFALTGLVACTGDDTDSGTGTHVTETDPCDCSDPEHADFDEDGDGICDIAECEDTGPSGGTGTFTAPMVQLPDGTLENCTSNLVGNKKTYTVPSGTTVDVEGDTYNTTYGDLSLATEASAWLPVHTAADGSAWISPSQSLPIANGDVESPEAPEMSRYASGNWTCNYSGSTDSSTSGEEMVGYLEDEDGLMITLPLGRFYIDGEDLNFSDSECANSGYFLNSEQLVVEISCSFGSEEDQCWKGSFDDRPQTW